MAKQIIKSKAKALEASAATIGDNSIGAEGKKYLADIGKLGAEARALTENFEKQSGKKMVEAVLLYQKAAKAGKLSADDAQLVADTYAGKTAPKQLVGDFKTFALPHVIKAASYALVPGATEGKSHFQSMMAVNRALTRFVKDKATKGKPLPTVNEKFVKAALEYSKAEPVKANVATKAGRKALAKPAVKRIRDFAAAIKALVSKGGLDENKSDLSLNTNQIKAIKDFVANFA